MDVLQHKIVWSASREGSVAGCNQQGTKKGSHNRGLFAHFCMLLLGLNLKGLTIR